MSRQRWPYDLKSRNAPRTPSQLSIRKLQFADKGRHRAGRNCTLKDGFEKRDELIAAGLFVSNLQDAITHHPCLRTPEACHHFHRRSLGNPRCEGEAHVFGCKVPEALLATPMVGIM